MIPKIGNIVNKLNSPGFINKASAPGMAKHYVGGLIVMNGVLRAAANEMDTKEKPSSRHYSALVEALHAGVCLVTHYAMIPLFGVAGLLLGKHVLAKKAFRQAGAKINFTQTQEKILAETATSAKKAANGFLKPVKHIFDKGIASIKSGFHRVKKAVGVQSIDDGIRKVNEYNRKLLDKVRINLDKGREIILQKGDRYYKIGGKNPEQNVLTALEGKAGDNILTPISGTAAKASESAKRSIIVPEMKFIGDGEKIHNNVTGSQKLGEALGMMAAITTISPLITNKFVPPLLKKFGLAQDDSSVKNQKISNKLQQIRQKLKMATKI